MLTLFLLSVISLNVLLTLKRLPTLLNPLTFYSIGWVFPLTLAVSQHVSYGISLAPDYLIFLFVVTLAMQICVMAPILSVAKSTNSVARVAAPTVNKVDLWQHRYTLLTVISMFALLLTYVDLGIIPVLDGANYKAARRLLRQSPFYSLYTVTMIAVPMKVYLYKRYGVQLSAKAKFLIGLWFSFSALTGWVGNLIYPLIMSAAAFSVGLRDKGGERGPVQRVLLFGLLFFLFISYLRSVFNLGLNMDFSTLVDERTWGRITLYLAYPFYNMQEVYLSSQTRSYGINLFFFISSLPILGEPISALYEAWFVDFKYEIGDNIYARGANTLTFIAPLFFDFGVYGLIFALLLAFFYGALYRRVIKITGADSSHVVVALYIAISMVFFMLFTGLHTRMLSFYVWPICAFTVQKLPRIVAR